MRNTGLDYIPSNPNYLINGGFEVNQRGVSSQTASGTRPIDQWIVYASGTNATIIASQQIFTPGQTDVPGEPKHYARCVVTGGTDTVASYITFNQSIEDVRTISGKICTLSFWAKADSALSIGIEFYQGFGAGGSTNVTIPIAKIALSTTWTKYIVPVTIPSISGKTIGAGSLTSATFWLSGGSNYNVRNSSLGIQSGTFEFAQVKLEAGTVATPFYSNYAEELRKCMRYYQILPIHFGDGSSLSSNTRRGMYTYPVRMRASPTINLTVQVFTGSVWANPTSSLAIGNEYGGRIDVSYSSTFMFVGHGTSQFANNFESGKLEASAEL